MTLRQLVSMAEGRGKGEWRRTALIAMLLANANRDPKKRRRPFSVDDFLPPAYRERTKRSGGIRVCKANREVLRRINAGGQK